MNAPHFHDRLPAERWALGAAGVGLGATLGLGIWRPTETLHSYLVALTYGVALALGALGWLMIFHAARARWMVILRRLLEATAATILPLALLFVPILRWAPRLFLWARVPGHLRVYLNVRFFIGRTIFYFVVWMTVAALLARWSAHQESGDGVRLLRRQRKLGAGALPLVGLTMSFAAFDWLMSLDTSWSSTIFGLYYIANALVGGLSITILATYFADRRGPLADLVRPAHYHSLGKLLHAFVCFWAYIAFSQLMLIWIAHLPEDVPWYLHRLHGGWGGIAVVLGIGRFGLPFFVLLSRDLKRDPRRLAIVAGWLLVMHYLDLYWLVMPALHPAGPRPSLADLTAPVGVVGVMVAFALRQLRGVAAVPLGDPYLDESMGYNA
jgi:hypothetical protein